MQVLAMNMDTSTPTGKLMLNLMGSFAEFEREIMLGVSGKALPRLRRRASTEVEPPLSGESCRCR